MMRRRREIVYQDPAEKLEPEEFAVHGAPENLDVVDPERIYIRKRTISHAPQPSILKNDYFIALLVLTLLNAVIFLHYSRTRQPALTVRDANSIIRSELGKQSEYFDPISDFVNFHGRYRSETSSEFLGSVARLREKLQNIGIDSEDLLQEEDFERRNGGIYWAAK